MLHDTERIELIDGEIVPMAPIGNRHNATVDRIVASFPALVGKRGIVRIQGSFRLNGKSMPEPDLLVLEPRADFYESEAATAEDVMLIGEVSESSLEYDRRREAPALRPARAEGVLAAQPDRPTHRGVWLPLRRHLPLRGLLPRRRHDQPARLSPTSASASPISSAG